MNINPIQFFAASMGSLIVYGLFGLKILLLTLVSLIVYEIIRRFVR